MFVNPQGAEGELGVVLNLYRGKNTLITALRLGVMYSDKASIFLLQIYKRCV